MDSSTSLGLGLPSVFKSNFDRATRTSSKSLWGPGLSKELRDNEGHNAFHIANDMTRKMHENLDWIILMLKYPRATVDVRNHRSKNFRRCGNNLVFHFNSYGDLFPLVVEQSSSGFFKSATQTPSPKILTPSLDNFDAVIRICDAVSTICMPNLECLIVELQSCPVSSEIESIAVVAATVVGEVVVRGDGVIWPSMIESAGGEEAAGGDDGSSGWSRATGCRKMVRKIGRRPEFVRGE
ncbi:hypothetical protein Tco_0280912 [Tanacetum coccineum]